MLLDSTVAAVVGTRPRAKPLPMTTTRKSVHGSPLKHDRIMFKDHHSALFRNLTFCTKLAFFCIRPPVNNPLGASPSKGKQGTTRGKEKIF